MTSRLSLRISLSLLTMAALTLTVPTVSLVRLHQREQAVVDHLHINGGYYWHVEYDWLGRVVLIRSHTNDCYSDTMCFQICTLSYLEVLELRGCRDLTDVSLKYFSKLPRLHTLNVENTNVTREGIARFRTNVPGCVLETSLKDKEDIGR